MNVYEEYNKTIIPSHYLHDQCEEEVVDYPYHQQDIETNLYDEDFMVDLPPPCPIDDLEQFPALKEACSNNGTQENLFRLPSGDYRSMMEPTHVQMNSSPISSSPSSPPIHSASYSCDYTLNSTNINKMKNNHHQEYHITNPHLSKLSTQLHHSYDDKRLNDSSNHKQRHYQSIPNQISLSHSQQEKHVDNYDNMEDVESMFYVRTPSYDYLDEVESAQLHRYNGNIAEFTM